jgi:hypothetical protein
MYTGHHWLYLNLADGDLNSFLPAWAAYRGILATPNVAMSNSARQTHLGLTPHIVRLFRSANAIALEKELALEVVRRERYPDAISRLNCVYCWPDETTATIAPKFWSKQGKHFNNRYLVEIGVQATKNPTIVDTRWIDNFVFLSPEPLEAIGFDWIDHYWQGQIFPWSGQDTIPEQPLMECLVDGTALIWGTELRMEAFAIVEKLAPDSVGILEEGRLGVDLCTRFDGTKEWRLGQITPVILTDSSRTTMWIRFPILLDESLANSVTTKIVAAGIKTKEINPRALQVFQKNNGKLPDLRSLEFSLAWIKNYPLLQSRLNQILTAFFLEHGGDLEAARKFQREAKN